MAGGLLQTTAKEFNQACIQPVVCTVCGYKTRISAVRSSSLKKGWLTWSLSGPCFTHCIKHVPLSDTRHGKTCKWEQLYWEFSFIKNTASQRRRGAFSTTPSVSHMSSICGPAILASDPVLSSNLTVRVCLCLYVCLFGCYPSCQCLVRTVSLCQMHEADPPARGCALMLPGLLLVLHNNRPEFLCHCFSVREWKHFSVEMDLSVDATACFQLTACRWNANFLPWCRLLFVAVTAGALLVLLGLASRPSATELPASSPH